MRSILTLILILFMGATALATSESIVVREVKVSVVEMPIITSEITFEFSSVNINSMAYLYMMKENIIRRALEFIPKKKWKQWS